MPDWIDRFVEYTANIGSPEIFRRWGAVATIAAALERKVWVFTRGSRMYPSVYIVLVAPPGIGKSEVTWRAREFILELKDHHVAAASLSKASLIDNLNSSIRRITRPEEVPAVVSFNSMFVCSNELGVLLPSYDTEIMNALTDLWDGKSYSERRRTKDISITVKEPQLNMLAACTPAYIMSTLPEGAWDQGFTSRTTFIYSGLMENVDLFSVEEESAELREELHTDLERIGNLYGEFHFTDEAKNAVREWAATGMQPVPEHPRLFSYTARRMAHMIKLAIILAASEGSDFLIGEETIYRAINMMLEAESFMPDMFKASGATSHARIIEDCWHFIFQAYTKSNKQPVIASRILSFISQRVPAHNVQRVLDVMISSNLIRQDIFTIGSKAFTGYVPVKRID